MYGIVKIGDKDVELMATASTSIRMKQIFGIDLMKSFQNAEGDKGAELSDVMAQLTYIMNCQAKKADMSKLNMDTFIEWSDDFGALDILNASESIINIYTGQAKPTSNSKKNKS